MAFSCAGKCMWQYPQFDPVALSLGPFQIHWYALSYLVGISLVWFYLGHRNRTVKLGWTDEQLSDLVFYAVLGVILGGRIGYMLFYGRDQLVEDPLRLFKIWEGGMSFHGGMIGVFLAMYLYGRKLGKSFFQMTDFIAPGVPIALGCGRIGNFINGELPGRMTDVPWAVIYPYETFGRHPSSLYQATLEGPMLFLLLWLWTRRERPTMSTSGMFLLGYGCFRFLSEFVRQPDLHMGNNGFIAFGWLTTGQLLSMPMILFGIGFLIYSYQRSGTANNAK